MVFSAHGSQKGHILWFVYTTPFERMVLQKRHYSTFKSSGVSFVRMLWINWPWNRCSYFETHKATQIYVHSWLLKWLSATWETAIQTRKKKKCVLAQFAQLKGCVHNRMWCNWVQFSPEMYSPETLFKDEKKLLQIQVTTFYSELW